MSEKPTDLYGTIEIATEQPQQEESSKPPRTPAKKRRSSPPKKRGARRTSIFWLSLVSVLFIIYTAAGYLLVPYLFQRSLPEQVQDRFSLVLESEAVRFNPFTFTFASTCTGNQRFFPPRRLLRFPFGHLGVFEGKNIAVFQERTRDLTCLRIEWKSALLSAECRF